MHQYSPLSKNDILDNDTFEKKRAVWREKIIALKKKRRVHVGPDITFYFENRETLLWQIQEMLFIEKGGDEQVEDELLAYNPLIPTGNELVATMMIEIDDIDRRHVMLRQWAYIDKHASIQVGDHRIHAVPEEDVDRIDSQGKTSAIHFLRFKMNPEQAAIFKTSSNVTLRIEHPYYTHSADITGDQLTHLAGDL